MKFSRVIRLACSRYSSQFSDFSDPITDSWTLLATACVSPKYVPGLNRFNPQQRLKDYVTSLRWYLTLTDSRFGPLVILENSGFGAENLLAEILSDPLISINRDIEILSYSAPDRPTGLHYGFSEFQMIDHLMDSSFLLTEKFVKVTGRYIFPDLSRLTALIPSELSFACDSTNRKKLRPIFWSDSRSANTSIFFARRPFFDANVRYLYKKMTSNPRLTHIEDIIFDIFFELNSTDVSLRFPIYIHPSGIGGNGDNLDSWSKQAKTYVRRFCRQFLPGYWL